MFCELILKAMPELVKYFQDLELGFYFTKPQIRHMQAFIVAMMMKGFCGKITNVSDLALHADRTCVGRFLDSDSWNDEYLTRALNAHVIGRIWNHARQTGLPIYVIIDDTIAEKTVPSSKAKRPIYGAGFHRSHLKNEIVYGHQFVSAVLRCGEMILPLSIVLYEKDAMSKIDIAASIIKTLPKPVKGGYVMTDSWYSSVALFDASQASGYHFIGALKSNRKIFPRGYRRKGIQIGAFARSLRVSDFDHVTVDGQCYYAYTYLGKINGGAKVKIVITYPLNALFVSRAMRAFISTDIKMNSKQLLLHYVMRWPIETLFREFNRHFGMKHCQVRSKKAILRYQYLLMLAYNFCEFSPQCNSSDFCKQRKSYQNNIDATRVSWIVQHALNGFSLNYILRSLRLPLPAC